MPHFVLIRPDSFPLSYVECDGPRYGTLCGWRHILSCCILGLATAITIRLACSLTPKNCSHRFSSRIIRSEPATVVFTVRKRGAQVTRDAYPSYFGFHCTRYLAGDPKKHLVKLWCMLGPQDTALRSSDDQSFRGRQKHRQPADYPETWWPEHEKRGYNSSLLAQEKDLLECGCLCSTQEAKI